MKLVEKLFLVSPLILQTLIWPITRPMLWFFLHLKIVGMENLKDLPRGVIFASNHSSELDPIIVPASLPFCSRFMPMFYVSRPRDFYKTSGWRQFFYGGIFFKFWGAHSAISGHKDYGLSLSSHINILRHGHSLIIYPEGQKTKTGDVMLERARGGVAFLAEKTELPIVPVYIHDVFDLSLKDFLLRRRRVSIIFGKPLYANEIFQQFALATNPYQEFSRKVLVEIGNFQKLFRSKTKSGNVNLGYRISTEQSLVSKKNELF
jgi:1-acyl-sn-glycerol-3-phosphate acyltransferase